MPDDSTTTTETTDTLTLDDAVVATGGDDDDEPGVPDEIRLSFSHAVTAETTDGFDLEGTLARIDGIRVGADDGDGDDDESPPGDRTLVLELTLAVTPGERPTISYDPDRGDVETATGFEPVPVDALPVSRGPPPRPLRAYAPADAPDEVRIVFDGEVESRTADATGFDLTGGEGEGPELTGELEVRGAAAGDEDGTDDAATDEVALPLASDLEREVAGDDDAQIVLEYGGNDDDEAVRRNLVSPDGAIVAPFDEPVDRDVDAEEIAFADASVPVDDRDRIHVRFDPPVVADTAAGFDLEGTLARIEGLEDDPEVDDGALEPHAVLELHIEVIGDEEPTIAYDPAEGDVRTASGTEPDAPLETDVETVGPEPVLQRAALSEEGDAVELAFSTPVVSRTNDASGVELAGVDDEGPELADRIETGEGETVELPLTHAVDELEEGVEITYAIDEEGGVNFVSADDGVLVEAFTRRVERADDT